MTWWGLSGAGFGPTPGNMNSVYHTELSSHEGTRRQFNGGKADIKLGIDVHQDFYVVVEQVDGSNPKPPQRFQKQAFLHWATKLKQSGAEVYAVYEACGFGFTLQRQLSELGIHCYVVCPQKLDEQNRRVKTDGLDAKALCLKLDRFVEGNRHALALVRVSSEEEEQARALHREREQLVNVRKVLEAQGRSLLVNHGMEPVQGWWKKRAFATLPAPEWIKELLGNSQPVVLLLQEKIDQLTRQLQNAANAEPPRGLGKMTSVIIEGRGSTPLSDYVQHRLIQLPICRVYHERHYRAALLIHDEHNSDISLDGASILDDRPRNQFFCDLRADISAVVAKNRQF